MDTVFDIATHAELAELLGSEGYPGEAKLFDREREIAAENPDYGLSLLAGLYALRDDMTKADDVIARIKDDQMRHDTMLSLHELEVAE